MIIEQEKIIELLEHFYNNVVVADNDNELILFKIKERGFVGTQTYCIQYNGKIQKKMKRLPTVVKYLNELITKYSLQDGVTLLLSELILETNTI